MSKRLNKEAVLQVEDTTQEWFEVPEWGGQVPLRSLNAWEQSNYQNGLMSIKQDHKGKFNTTPNLTGANVKLAALGIADDGGPWFTVEELKGKSAAAINRIAERIREISGMDSSVEDAEGN